MMVVYHHTAMIWNASRAYVRAALLGSMCLNSMCQSLLQLSCTRRFLKVVRLLIDVTRTLPSCKPLHHLALEYRRAKANYCYVFPYNPVLYLDNQRVRKPTSTEIHF